MNAGRCLTRGLILGLAVFAMTAHAASAVTVTNEGGSTCSALTIADHTVTGGCQFSGTNSFGTTVELRAVFGIMYLCDYVFSGRLNGSGEGFIYNQTLRAPGTSNPCTVQPANEADGHPKPWPIELTAENGCGNSCDMLEMVFSLTGPFGIIANCHGQLEIRQITHNSFRLTTRGAGLTHDFCEGAPFDALMGSWDGATPSPGIEIG